MKEQLDRIEAKVDRLEAAMNALLEALADDCDDEEQAFDLDGNPLGYERDPLEPL